MGKMPVQTAPNPSASTASKRFCVAAEQSCTQNPGTMTFRRVGAHEYAEWCAFHHVRKRAKRRNGVWHLAIRYGNELPHCCSFAADGALIAAASSLLNVSSSTVLSVHRRTLHRVCIASSESIDLCLRVSSLMSRQSASLVPKVFCARCRSRRNNGWRRRN